MMTLMQKLSFSLLLWLVGFSALAEGRLVEVLVKDTKGAVHKSREGRPIKVLFDNNNYKKRVFIQSGLHGNETLPVDFVLWVAKRYNSGKSLLNKLNLKDVGVDFSLEASPDGVASLSRYNGNEVNLNRNFSILWGMTRENPGTSAFSEPEAKAIRDLFKQRKYFGSVDVHGYVNWIVLPSNIKANGNNSPQFLKKVQKRNVLAHMIQRNMPSLPRHQVKSAAGLGDGGAFEDWAFWKGDAYSFCLEMADQVRTIKGKDGKPRDMFAVYERFIYRVFMDIINAEEQNRVAYQ